MPFKMYSHSSIQYYANLSFFLYLVINYQTTPYCMLVEYWALNRLYCHCVLARFCWLTFIWREHVARVHKQDTMYSYSLRAAMAILLGSNQFFQLLILNHVHCAIKLVRCSNREVNNVIFLGILLDFCENFYLCSRMCEMCSHAYMCTTSR